MSAKRKKPAPGKPRLAVLKGREITAEDVAALFRHLTGRTATPEEVEEARKSLEGEAGPRKEGEG
jgi:hypothetical protein